MKSIILKLILAIWLIIWALFLVRELFIKGHIREYKTLWSRSIEDKRAYVTGDKFYEFLAFCKKSIPESAAYDLMMKSDVDTIQERRAVYYLYPDLKAGNPEFILVYDQPDITKAGYEIFAKFDNSSYILKKKR